LSKGLPDAAALRPQLELTVRNHKKAEIIIKKLGATPTLQAAAAAYGKEVLTAGADSTITFSSQIVNGVGMEPKLIGAAFDKNNQTKASAPIEGVNGVYVVQTLSTGSKPADAPDVQAQILKNRKQALQSQISYGWFESLKKSADITDNRSKFN